MKNNYKLIWFLFVVMISTSCKERFEPNLPSVPQGYLVVEGFINAQGPTQIKLSRSVSVNQKKVLKPEFNAIVRIEGDDNTSFNLFAGANGEYASGTLPINAQKKYRIYIKTRNRSEYRSDFCPVKITPRIDSINWKQEENKVTVYANTHDPNNNTIYYLWDYDETWEIHSPYVAGVKVDNGRIRDLTPNDTAVSVCWKYDTSSTIVLGSSARLENDVIHLNPLVSYSPDDEKLGVRYSIQVRQYAINKETYSFLDQMRKSTETLGTIFDAQPTELRGNIHSLADPKERVIGYMYATTVQEERIFISGNQLTGRNYALRECIYFPVEQTSSPGFLCCYVDTFNITETLQNYPGYLPYQGIYNLAGTLIGTIVSTNFCVDCRLRGGTTVKPSFW